MCMINTWYDRKGNVETIADFAEYSGVDKPQEKDALWGLRYAEFVVPLVKAVQEQQQQIEEMKNTHRAQIEALQKEIDSIKNKLK